MLLRPQPYSCFVSLTWFQKAALLNPLTMFYVSFTFYIDIPFIVIPLLLFFCDDTNVFSILSRPVPLIKVPNISWLLTKCLSVFTVSIIKPSTCSFPIRCTVIGTSLYFNSAFSYIFPIPVMIMSPPAIITLLEVKSLTECSWVCDPSGFTIVKFPENIALAPAVALFGDDEDEEEL